MYATRAAVGLRPPRARSTNVDASRGGIAVHWGGPRQQLGSHARCLEIWRAWQRYHMDSHGWADIAYNFGFCQHGWVLEGRGGGVRSAAQGTSDGNFRYEAACWIGGQGDGPPTPDALDALDWIIDSRRRAGAGREVRPHRWFTGTSCPGPDLLAHVPSRHMRPVPQPEPETSWLEDIMAAGEKQLADIAAAIVRDARARERQAAAQTALAAVEAARYVGLLRKQYGGTPDPHSDAVHGQRVAEGETTLKDVGDRLGG